ncbi:MAG TPA: nuclear transport factor 2 family protein [Candidatus Sulfotelmatobacter sp.]|nr:nuclear transport factor 2 family protein [Candidatus Sulfotelmatobacter sp.]
MYSKENAVNVRPWRARSLCTLLLLTLCLAAACPAAAQKKKKKDDTPVTPASAMASLPDEQKIDYAIGQMLGAWQVGDTQMMHKYYAEDVSVVAGTWTPPAMGWTNYLAAYQAQRARLQQVRLERSNTLIRIAPSGTVAWACYQWEFSAMVDGSPSAADGQTTLVLEKRGDSWLIVHNHTSLVQASQPFTPASPATQPAAPAKP